MSPSFVEKPAQSGRARPARVEASGRDKEMSEGELSRKELLAHRGRWVQGLQLGGREELVFELDMLLRALELAIEQRYHTGERGPFGTDYAEQLRATRNALHRAALLSQRLSNPDVERGYHFRSYLERLHADARAPRLTRELVAQRSPEESLYLLRQSLTALQRISDQLLRLPVVTFTTFSDFGTLVEQSILSSRFFRPPALLEPRPEYDRVPPVRVLELLQELDDERCRKATFLAFLACFRILRQLRLIPSGTAVMPRRALLILHLARVESTTLANFLEADFPRIISRSTCSKPLLEHTRKASANLRALAVECREQLRRGQIGREKLQQLGIGLSSALKATASALVSALDPNTEEHRLFDEETVQKERALHLRSQLWMLNRLLSNVSQTQANSSSPEQMEVEIRLLLRFYAQFREVGYHLLRQEDREFVRYGFNKLHTLQKGPLSHHQLNERQFEIQRLQLQLDRSLAMISRRSELLNQPLDEAPLLEQLERFRSEAKERDDTLPPFADSESGSDIFQALSAALSSTEAEWLQTEADEEVSAFEDDQESGTQPYGTQASDTETSEAPTPEVPNPESQATESQISERSSEASEARGS